MNHRIVTILLILHISSLQLLLHALPTGNNPGGGSYSSDNSVQVKIDPAARRRALKQQQEETKKALLALSPADMARQNPTPAQADLVEQIAAVRAAKIIALSTLPLELQQHNPLNAKKEHDSQAASILDGIKLDPRLHSLLLSRSRLTKIFNYEKSRAAYSPDGAVLALSNNNTVTLLDPKNFAVVKKLELGFLQKVNHVAFDPLNPDKLFIGIHTPIVGNYLHQWNISQQQNHKLLYRDFANLPVYIPVQLTDGKAAIIGKHTDATTCIKAKKFTEKTPLKSSITFADQKGSVLFFDVESLTKIKAVIFSADGTRVALLEESLEMLSDTFDGRQDQSVKIWNIKDLQKPRWSAGAQTAQSPSHVFRTPVAENVNRAILSPDGNYLITAKKVRGPISLLYPSEDPDDWGKDPVIMIDIDFWDIENKKKLCGISTGKNFYFDPSKNSDIYSMAMRPDGRQLFISDKNHGYLLNLDPNFFDATTIDIDKELSKLTLRQFELMEGFAQAIEDRARIHPDKDQWETFQSLPADFQEKLKLYIKAPESATNNNTK